MTIQIKRVYEPPSPTDGTRILVDRLWPRGLTKEKAKVDLWLKEIAPCNELRKWFSHDPAKWTEFQSRYRTELKSHAEQIAELRHLLTRGPVTLLYGAHDEQHNQAIALQKLLRLK